MENAIEFYENEEGFGIYCAEGLDIKVIMQAIEDTWGTI